MSKVKKVVLAYSGGLDTSAIIPWLRENYQCEVIAYAADVGQGEELDPLHEKAKQSGASKLIIKDLKEEFARDYVLPCLRAGAIYEGKYLLGTSVARPIIAKYQALIALEEGADAVAHGCTGKGNDQVRFELAVRSIAPQLRIIAPWREWTMKSREDLLAYCAKHNVAVTASAKKIYSMDRNLWHQSVEGGTLEDPWQSPSEDMYVLTKPPKDAPEPREIVISFQEGVPTAVDGQAMTPAKLILFLNGTAGRYGIGRVDIVESRLVGMKSHGVYEAPAATVLREAYEDLARLVLDRESLWLRETLGPTYTRMVYDGRWFTVTREAMDAFFATLGAKVTGEVRVRLDRGYCVAVGRRSPNSLYDPELATFGEDAVYRQKDAEGFIRLFGLPIEVEGRVRRRKLGSAPNFPEGGS
ncbi:argininosuccinate synthase [bacterium]|nr:argininosuccinate synthase [bacterium]